VVTTSATGASLEHSIAVRQTLPQSLSGGLQSGLTWERSQTWTREWRGADGRGPTRCGVVKVMIASSGGISPF
jgi:hypothetical protein